ncbi:MAG: TatD family hydrolase [Chitinispirillaceae bacterium]|nr:TatD family hydrolase [Chitinispirillaceae bacterium]
MWIDSHAHLDRLPEDALPRLIAEADAAGVGLILSAATDLGSAESVTRLCGMFPGVYGAAGISPFDVEGIAGDWEERLKALLIHDKMVAAGEIGLDRSNPRYPTIECQKPVFTRQLAIAQELRLPVVVHSRGAEREVATICREQGITRALFHCFTGTAGSLDFLLQCGYHVSFSGIVTFSGAVRELAARVPLDRLLIETDSPYLAPVPYRGKTNQPAWAAITGECIADAKGMSAETLQKAMAENFERLFLCR